MTLAARSACPPQKKNREQCSVCILVENLPKEEADALDEMFRSHLWSGAAIARAITDEGLGRISDNTIRRHRRGECFRESYTETG